MRRFGRVRKAVVRRVGGRLRQLHPAEGVPPVAGIGPAIRPEGGSARRGSRDREVGVRTGRLRPRASGVSPIPRADGAEDRADARGYWRSTARSNHGLTPEVTRSARPDQTRTTEVATVGEGLDRPCRASEKI